MERQEGADVEIARVSVEKCPRCGARSSRTRRFYRRHGFYRTRWNGRVVPRYRCGPCGSTFSPQTFRETYRQHRPDVNAIVLKLYASGMTQRRMAKVLAVSHSTIERKFRFLAELARRAHDAWLSLQTDVSLVHFDEMETFEHTKLKPVSIALAVQARTGAILGVSAEPMGYKGPLAKAAFEKYGPRTDRSGFAIARVLKCVARVAGPHCLVVTDQSSKYPQRLRTHLPTATHRAVRRVPPPLAQRRRNVDDPLFALNVTAAKLRNDLSRLSRKTWVTTKKIPRLDEHLALYVAWNNGYRLAL